MSRLVVIYLISHLVTLAQPSWHIVNRHSTCSRCASILATTQCTVLAGPPLKRALVTRCCVVSYRRHLLCRRFGGLDLGVWGASPEVAVTMLSGTAAISRLDWGWKLYLHDCYIWSHPFDFLQTIEIISITKWGTYFLWGGYWVTFGAT